MPSSTAPIVPRLVRRPLLHPRIGTQDASAARTGPARQLGQRRPAAPPAEPPAPQAPPTAIGSYDIERKLGGGGMAEVFLARKRGLLGFSRPVAIKRVLPSFASHPRAASLFVAEARVSARLCHPNIVSVLDFKHDRAHGLYLVMELVEGPDLAQLVGTGPLPPPCCIFIAIETLRGLGYAHHLPQGDARGVIHRDISPQNVLLSWQGAVKISDFGIAKVRSTSIASASAVVKGKPAYMSPEQASGRALDERADLFSLGVVLWEMLVGRPLFGGATVQEVLSALLFAPIPSPRTLRPEVPQELAQVVLGLLQRDPNRRYASAEQVIGALAACAAAPRDGRTELATLLRARFASEAPALADGVVREAIAIAPTALLSAGGGSAAGTPDSFASAVRCAALPERARSNDASCAVTLVRPRRRSRRAWWLGLVACGVAILLASPRSNAGDEGPRRPEPASASLEDRASPGRWSPLTGHFAWRSLLQQIATPQPVAPAGPRKSKSKSKRAIKPRAPTPAPACVQRAPLR